MPNLAFEVGAFEEDEDEDNDEDAFYQGIDIDNDDMTLEELMDELDELLIGDDGEIKKCPECGKVMDALDKQCELCGFIIIE